MASKAFTRFRRRLLGDDDTVNFHSLRRSFATYLERAKVGDSLEAELMGHSKKTLSKSVYSGGMTAAQRREAVEAMAAQIEHEVAKAVRGVGGGGAEDAAEQVGDAGPPGAPASAADDVDGGDRGR